MPSAETPEELTDRWRGMLTGSEPQLAQIRQRMRRIPSDPRCKMCSAPFGAPGGFVLRLMRHGRHRDNPLLCDLCYGTLRKQPGGAEVEISVLFADIRGSTGIAEQLGATGFRTLLQHFYTVAEHAVTAEDGAIDKLMGDGVMALFIPGFTGQAHARHAIAAGRRILSGVVESPATRLPVGVGIHTGVSYVGVVGSGDDLDFSALGDVVNVSARLGSLAEAGQLLASAQTLVAAGLDATEFEPHDVEVRGRTEPVAVVDLSEAEVAVSPSAR